MEQLINRVKQILLQPKEEWEVIAKEETPMMKMITSYVLPLSLIGVVASFIGFGLIGIKVPFFGRMATIEWGFYSAITHIVTVLVGVVLSGYIISVLAPSFGTKLSLDEGVKLVGYSYTPILIAAVFSIIPNLAILGSLIGLYGLFLLYMGFKPITKVTEDKLTGYFLVSLLVMIVVFFVLGLILGAIFSVGISASDFTRGWGF
jgi:hypothetical protein